MALLEVIGVGIQSINSIGEGISNLIILIDKCKNKNKSRVNIRIDKYRRAVIRN